MENISLDVTLDEIIQELDDKNLLYLTSGKIKELKNNVLQKLVITRDEILHFHKVLKEYRYIDELDEIKIGGYIRWINLHDPENVKLTNGGIIVDIQNGKEDLQIICKNRMNRMFSLNLQSCLIFQKMNAQEKILIKIIDYASK
jgi:hypothetical protein